MIEANEKTGPFPLRTSHAVKYQKIVWMMANRGPRFPTKLSFFYNKKQYSLVAMCKTCAGMEWSRMTLCKKMELHGTTCIS